MKAKDNNEGNNKTATEINILNGKQISLNIDSIFDSHFRSCGRTFYKTYIIACCRRIHTLLRHREISVPRVCVTN